MQYYEKASQSTDANLKYTTLLSQADAMLLSDRPAQMVYPLLNQAIALRPNADEARMLLARALMREGTISSQDRAIEELRAVTTDVRSVPLASKAYTLMGIIWYKQGQLNRSLDAFNRALELDPANGEAFQNRRAVSDRLENG
ncbi:MAG TPA: tetratricopeptide repeat protein, partial [Turneriella sp.]|nr:tetratricopeptide repeat protein [Turneriella sp.]